MNITLKLALTLICLVLSPWCLPSLANEPAKELPRLESKADAARALSRETEAAQLQKAREASVQADVRIKKTLKKTLKAQQHSDWQTEQQHKAQLGFKQRESREKHYLEEAKQAAGQEKKLINKQPVTKVEDK